MTYALTVFCRSAKSLTRREIADFLEEGSYFDELDFEPAATEALAKADWKTLTVRYQKGKEPVVLARNPQDTAARELVEELHFVLERSRDSKGKREIEERLGSAQQVFRIEVERDEMTDDTWEMLDALEAFLARERDGMVYAPDDGFFDQKLKRFYRL